MRRLLATSLIAGIAVMLSAAGAPPPAGAQEPSAASGAGLLPVPFPDPCDPLLGDADGDGWADRCECGDVNGDGFVDTTDARLIQRCVVGELPCSDACDVSGDGRCTTTDARLIQRYAVGDLPKHALRCEKRRRCCDPALEPGVGGNPLCFEGASCCADGRWACNRADGTPSCEPGAVCEDRCAPVLCDLYCPFGFQLDPEGCPVCACQEPPRCCDPAEEPGVSGGPLCIEGASCCRDGEWRCNQGDGTPSCRPGSVCPAGRCCDPEAQPGVGGNPLCIEGASCCADGRWACNQGDGTPSCEVLGRVCPDRCPPVLCEIFCPFGFQVDEQGCEICACRELPRCCDPEAKPGVGGNPLCFEGASCCADGYWACNRADGRPSCDAPGKVCEACCDPDRAPGVGGNPLCFEGASCCADGRWACNQGDGTPSCEALGHVCGPEPCRSSADCKAEELCAKPPGRCEGEGLCRPRPEACILVIDPVCGCDGKTYGNACQAAQEGVSVAHEGACRLPVCDSDRDCAAGAFCEVEACGAIDVSPAGICVPKPDACPKLYEPVCGCDGETYANDCERRRAGVSRAHPGACREICGGIAGIPCSTPDEICVFPPGTCNVADNQGTCTERPEVCPLFFDPVCGCDGRTYSNACDALRAGVQIDHPGRCAERCESSQDCGEGEICFPPSRLCQPPCEIACLVADPVCGSDGVTYACGAADAHCHGAEVLHPGPCQE